MVMVFWVQSMNSMVWSVICLTIIKVLTNTIFIIVGICVDTGTAGGVYYVVFNFHLPGGALSNGFFGVFNVLIIAAFSFNGVEIVGITAGESENPHKRVPAAVKQVFFCIVLFYILSMLIIGLIIPYTDPELLQGSGNISVSPFTLVFQKAGAAWAADLMYAVILLTMISASNSGVYSSSRTLLALAEAGSAPRIFKRVNRWGTPIRFVLATCLVGCLALLTSLFSSSVVFNWLSALYSVTGLIVWVTIFITHIRFRQSLKALGSFLTTLPYIAPFFPYGNIFVIVLGSIVITFQGYQTFIPPIVATNCVSSYLSIMLCVVLYDGHKIIKRPSFVKASEMDFETGPYMPDPISVKEGGFDEDVILPLWRCILKKIYHIIA